MNKKICVIKLGLFLLLLCTFFSCNQKAKDIEKKGGDASQGGNVIPNPDVPVLDANTRIEKLFVYNEEISAGQDGKYEAVVSKETQSAQIANNVTVKCESAKSTFTVKEKDASSLGENEGDSKLFVINVKAENGSSADYELKIVRGKSANAYLKSLFTNKGSLTFEKTKFAYRVELQDSITELNVSQTITAEQEDPEATLTIEPKDEIQIEDMPIVRIIVVAADGHSKNEYSITFAHKEKIKYVELQDVITQEKTIQGALPIWWDSLPATEKQPFVKGVFVEGRSVKIAPYKIGKYEVSYKLWYDVREWAEENGYKFKNKGCPGTNIGGIDPETKAVENDGALPLEEFKYLPVSRITWCDAVVWCNAYSQREGVSPVYYYKGEIIKDANAKEGDVSILAYAKMQEGAEGYRLPTEAEWEFAARGGDASLKEWNFKFGVSDDPAGATIALPGQASAENPSNVITHDFKNRLNLFNMCGNMGEMCWDWYEQFLDENTPSDGPIIPTSFITIKKTKRGGCLSFSSATGGAGPAYVTDRTDIEAEGQVSTTMGFRVARSIR